MNYAYTIPSSIRKTAALLATVTLLATSMPLVAYAANEHIAHIGISSSASGDLEINQTRNFVLQAQDSTNASTSTAASLVVTLSDGSATGTFYEGTVGGDCNAPLGGNTVTISSGDAQKAFCYSNSVPGNYTITAEANNDSTTISGNTSVDVVDTSTPPGTLTAEEFVAVDGSYKGISVGFRTEGFGTTTAVSVTMERADGSTVTKTANQGVLDIINQDTAGGDQLTAPFVIEEGTFTEAGDTTYWNPAPASWSQATRPVQVTITVTDENGDVSVVNNTFNDGAPSWPTYESLLSAPTCDTNDTVANTTFDTFVLGSVNGQNGWSATNAAYDQEVVENTYGYSSFGCQSLRVSDAVTSGSFGDWVISASTASAAGESSIAANSRFEMEFDIASTMPNSEQSGLQVSVAPHDGTGSRMSYLGFADQADGIHVTFFDATNPGPLPSATSFNGTDIATLDRSVPHTVRLVMDFVDGPGNDVVEVYIDGTLEHTGTSWENYYRYDAEQTGNGNVLWPTDSIIIQARGTAHPANDDNGYLFDNISLNTGATPPPAPKTTETIEVSGDTAAGENQSGWLFNRDTSTATPFEFNTNAASIGDGALYVLPIGSTTPSDKFIAEYFALAQMGDVDSFSYDFNIGPNATTSDANEFYLNVYANFGVSSSTKFYDCRYNIVPASGTVGGWTTVTFDPALTYPVTTRTGPEASPSACPSSPAAMGADAVIRAFAINVGDTSDDDAGIDGYLDNVIFETDTKVTTFDFEPEAATTPDDEEDDDRSSSSGGSVGGSGPTPRVLGASTDQEILDLLNAIEVRLYELLAQRNASIPAPAPAGNVAGASVTPPPSEEGDEEVVEEEDETSTSTPTVVSKDDDEDGLADAATEIPWSWIAWALVVLWILATAGAFWHRDRNPGSIAIKAVQGVFGAIGLALLAVFFLFGLAGALFWPALIVTVGAVTTYFWTLD